MNDSAFVAPLAPWPPQWPVRGVEHQGATAAVSLEGGQLLSWRCLERERLFVSPHSAFLAGSAIRGGIPIIFPQFGTRGRGARHGVARLQRWTERPGGHDPARIALELSDNATLSAAWPHSFDATLIVGLGTDRLATTLTIENTGSEAFSFTGALHTYLRVSDLTNVRLWGLQGQPFFDAASQNRVATQRETMLEFKQEVDRIYGQAPDRLVLIDGGDRLAIDQSGFCDTVVWNPGAALAEALPDLGAGNHRHFVCVEAACVENPVHLLPGQLWSGSQTLRVLTADDACLG